MKALKHVNRQSGIAVVIPVAQQKEIMQFAFDAGFDGECLLDDIWQAMKHYAANFELFCNGGDFSRARHAPACLNELGYHVSWLDSSALYIAPHSCARLRIAGYGDLRGMRGFLFEVNRKNQVVFSGIDWVDHTGDLQSNYNRAAKSAISRMMRGK
jgi:hypothetical protein